MAVLELLDVVALTEDMPEQQLAAGCVGTVVELLDADTVLVEFADSSGASVAIAPVRTDMLRKVVG